MDFDADQSLKEWVKDKPLSILQLDPADRAVLRIADERDAIQKKTFTKWVNKHLKKAYTCLHVCSDPGCCTANLHVNDLFIDLQDGLNLISLLEVLSGEQLPREKGRLRFHMLQNVQMALDFLRYKKIKLVNIRAEDIVDGNPKLTLGLIWTIILHFQISDIVVGEESNVSAKEALLKWARRSTTKYPGVKVNDFTSSWRDGLAFNAIIHRNRPDLIDWRDIRQRVVRERLENAFHIAEREYGVTRLLDPEDVDTHEIDEKSIITYISSLYDVFPEPPPVHPLSKYSESIEEVNIEMTREQTIHEEKKRLDRLQRLADKVHREIKRIDIQMEDTESKIKEESRRLERLHPLDAKHNIDLLEQELRVTDENIQSLFTDVQTLHEGRYPQASDLNKRVEKLHQRWLSLRSLLHSRLIAPLSSLSFPFVEEHTVTRQTRTILETRLIDTNPYFKNLQECIEWCSRKLKQIQEADYGSDLPGVQAELNSHLREHNSIEQFHARCEQCINAKNNFHGDELAVYTQHLNTLQKLYTELLSTSSKRLSDLETLLDFLQSVSNHLMWLNEKEEIELTRDWSDRDLDLVRVQQYYKTLMTELEKREIQFQAMQDRGESLLLQHHPASKTIDSYMSAMNNQWSWILELILCLETHLKHSSYYQQFYKDVREAETWLNKRDELLNTTYSQSDFTLDEGERLLKGMQELREELNSYSEVVQNLAERAQNVVPLKQRRQPVTRPIPILAICNYKQNNVHIQKGDQWVLHDNSGRIKWRVSSGASNSDCNIPGVVFLIPPPDKEALEAVERLKRQFERSIALWQRKQLRMRQNMIFSTIKVVRSWDLAQFLAMGADQRNAIRKALNEDAAKLLEEGDPADPQLRRLRREMDEVNRLFDEFERRAREDEENRNATRVFNDKVALLQAALDEAEHTLNTKLNSPIPRDVDSLEHLVIQHRDFETRLKALSSDMDTVQDAFKAISRKTPAIQAKMDRVSNQWNNLWNLSHLYVERLKCVEVVLSGVNEMNHVLSDFEIKLASYGEMPSELEALKAVHKDLLTLQNNVTMQQSVMDQLMEDGRNARRLVEKSRHHIHHGGPHHDLDRLDTELNRLTTRWNNICSQLVDRLRSCEAAYGLLEKYANSYQQEVKIIDESYQKLNALTPIKSQAIEQIEPTKKLFKNVMERIPAVEQVNIDGGRFIREAKIYDVRLLHYCEWLVDEVHPQLQSSVTNKKKIKLEYMSGCGETAVSHELDMLNNRFEALMNVLYDRIKQMATLYPDDVQLKELVFNMEPKPLKTFRTEFSIYEQSSSATYISSPDRITNGKDTVDVSSNNTFYINDSRNDRTFDSESPQSAVRMGTSSSMPLNGNVAYESMHFTEIRSLRKANKSEDCVGSGHRNGFDITEMKGIVHPETKEVLTVEDAIRLRILDVRTGKIAVSSGGGPAKTTYISIEDAVKCGLVMPELAAKLLGPCGISRDGGETPISLLEAIQRELVDAERGPMERLKVNLVGGVSKEVSIADDEDGGDDAASTSASLSSSSSNSHRVANLALSLYDLICLDMVDRRTGLIYDRDTGNRLSIKQAVEKGIVDDRIREIVDTANDTKITLNEAINQRLIENEKYHHRLSGETITLHEAKRRRLIVKPLSLKDCVDMEVMEENGQFKSPIYRTDVPLLEAIRLGVLDADLHKTVVNKQTGQLVTLGDALNDEIITPTSLYVDKKSKEMIPVPSAVERGLLYSVTVKSVFDIAAFRLERSDEYVDLNRALDTGLVKKQGNKVCYRFNGKMIPVEGAAEKNCFRPEVMKMLSKKVGIKRDSGGEMTVLEAAVFGYINPKTGILVDKSRNREVPFNKAVKKKLITAEGVATLKSLLAITLSTQTITKTVVRYATTVQLPSTNTVESFELGITHKKLDDEVPCEEHQAQQTKSTKSPIKEKLIKMLEPLQMKAEPVPEAAADAQGKEVDQFEVPPEGWDLEMAIKERYFDPVNGLFIIPGTDRLVSFEECVKLEIINPKSAVVIESGKGRKLSLERSLEKQILNCTGHYLIKEDERITMKEAIDRSLILFVTSATVPSKKDSPRFVQFAKFTLAADDEPQQPLEPVQIRPNTIFDPETALVIFVDRNSSDNIVNAVKSDKIDPSQIRMALSPGLEMTLQEAVQNHLVDLESETYRDREGREINLNQAIKTGVIAILGCSLTAAKKVTDTMSSMRVTSDPASASKPALCRLESTSIPSDDEDQGPSLAQLTRSRVTTEPKYLVSIGKATKSVSPAIEGARPVILQKMRKKKVKPKDAVNSGLIDKTTAELFESLENMTDSQGKQLSLFEALDLTNANPNAKLIRDPQRGDMISIKEAVERGILDESTSAIKLLIPIAKSLSLPDLLRQGLVENGRIIHPETGTNISLPEAIACDIVDPLSRIKDPTSGNVLTLEDAIKEGIVGQNLQIKTISGDVVDLVDVSSGDQNDLFVDEPQNLAGPQLPPAGMTLPVALQKGLYNSDTNEIKHPLTGEKKPLEVAIREGLIMSVPFYENLEQSEVMVIGSQAETNFAMSKDEYDTVDEFLQSYDEASANFKDPKQGDTVTFEEAVRRNVINPETVIYDSASQRTVKLRDAIASGLVDAKKGTLKDACGNSVSVRDAVKLGLLTVLGAPLLAGKVVMDVCRKGGQANSQVTSGTPTWDNYITITKHLTPKDLALRGVYDTKNQVFLHPETGEEITFRNLILNENLFRVNNIYVKDLEEIDSYLPIQSALTFDLVDSEEGFMTDPNTERRITFFESVKLGWITELDSPRQNRTIIGVTFDEAIEAGIVDRRTCKVNVEPGQLLDLHVCLTTGFIIAESVSVRNPFTDEVLSLTEAVDCGMVDLNVGLLRVADAQFDMATAFGKGLVFPCRKPVCLVAVVRNGRYNRNKNKIIDDTTADCVSLEEAISRQIVDPTLAECKDIKSNEYVILDKAMHTGLVSNCCLNNTITGKPIKLDTAIGEKLIISRPFKMNLMDAVLCKYYDPKTGMVLNPCAGSWQSVQEACEAQFIDIDEIKIKDVIHDRYLPIHQAVSEGLIDLKKGQVLVPVEMNLRTAIEKNYMVMEIPVSSGQPRADDKKRKIMKLVIDPSSVILKYDNKTLSFEHAIDEGLIDAQKSLVKIGQRKISFHEAIDAGILIEVRRPMTLKEAINKGVFDEKTGLFLDPNIGKYLTLKEAIDKNLLDPNSVLVRDTRTDPAKKLALMEALSAGLVSGETATITNPATGAKVSLIQAYNEGLMLDNKTMMPLQKALDLGFYDETDGKVINPNSGDKLTLKEATKQRIINYATPCYWDKSNEKVLSLKDTCDRGLIDDIHGRFRTPRHNKSLNLVEASNLGFIVKIENIGLYEASTMGFFHEGLYVNPENDRRLSLREAVKQNLIDAEASLVKSLEYDSFVKLPQAIELRIIDDVSGTYAMPKNNELIGFREACKRGLIIPNFDKLLNDAVEYAHFDDKTGTIVDPVTSRCISIQEAIEKEIVSSGVMLIKDPKNDEYKLLNIPAVDGQIVAREEAPLQQQQQQQQAAKKQRHQQIKIVDGLECTLQFAIDERLLDTQTAVMRSTTTCREFCPIGTLLEDKIIEPKMTIKFSSNGCEQVPRKATSRRGDIYVKKPFSLAQTVRLKSLNTKTASLRDPESNAVVSLKDALAVGFIDPDSALVKDYTNVRLLKLDESIKKGIFDPDKNTIIDANSSRLYNLAEALENGLVVTDSLPFMESLHFGLYNPVTGLFNDPFESARKSDVFAGSNTKTRRKLTLDQCVKVGIVDPSSFYVKDTTEGAILTYEQAVDKFILDAVAGKYLETANNRTMDLLKAKNHGYLVPANTRQAMEEKYRLTDDTLSDLLSWISEIEDRISNQDVAQEDVNQLRNQINILKLLKEEIDSQARPVTSCLDQVRQVVATGSEYLSRDEISNLERKGKSLRTRYDRANERTDKLLRRLSAARDELTKFKNDLTIFTTWMEKAQKTLEEKEKSISNLNKIDGSFESTRDFVSDVIAHQADLRFITMAAQKFVDESKEYLTCLNEFRTSLPSRLSHIEPISAQDSVVRNTVASVSSQYRDLLARVNALSDKLSGLGSKQKEYRDALGAAKAWLREAEPRANKILIEPVAADPNALEDQLSRTKALNNEFVSQGRLVDNAKQALDALIRSLEGQLSPGEMANLKNPVIEIEDKYRQLCDALADKCQTLDNALVQSQGVQDALDSLLHWLNDAENTLKNITRPASLHKERLEDQMREHRVLRADVDSHRTSVDSVTQSAQQLINTASNPRLAKKIETKLRDVVSRYDKLLDKVIKRNELLAEIHHGLTVFNDQASSLERWLGEALEVVPEASDNKVEDLIAQKETLKHTLDQVIRDGKALINHKDVTDTANVRDRIKALETLWKDLNQLLDEKHRNTKLRSEQLNAYEKLRDQVLVWLTNIENRVNRLDPVAVEMEMVKKQIEELKPILKEHREYATTIDKVNDLGNAFDSLSRPETPTRRRNTASPTKRTTLGATYGRRGSQDSTPSPSRGLGYLTQSPGGSSGFGSRRSSQDGFLLDELSDVQQQLAEINNRYNLLGARLSDRQSELDNIKEELRKHLEHFRSLSQFLDKIQRMLPKETIPQSKEDADKLAKNIKSILEEMYEKQALLESTRAGISDLLRKKPTAYGADILHDEIQEISARWKNLNDQCKDRIQLLETLKDFHDTHDNLSNWLSAKDRMMTVLGPISSDSRMVQSQVQQVAVLREEFRTQQPQLNHFKNIGENILTQVPDRKSPDAQKISGKLANIQKRWNDLLSRLDERAENLGAAADSSREFDAGLARLRDALQNISDQLDDIPLDKEPEEQLRKVQALERQLEGQRPLLADLEAAGAQLCEVLSDPTSRAEIQGKLSAVNRQYNNLQKKLDHRKAEIEGSLRDGRQFEATCAKSLGWLGEQLGQLPERLLVSADREVLQQQVDQHEPIYKEVMHKEHEIIMLLNKGRDQLARSTQLNRTDSRNLQRELDKIQQLWDRLRRDAVERQTRLQTCMEHCRKYYKALETFIPWLSQAENKLDSLRPDTFKRTDVEKQLRELSLFRNDVWKHSGEFENLKTLGETFLAACDVDKELVKQELAAVKTRWDKLNNELLERTQWLEDTARRLADFSENLRDLGHSVQRCEDKLASHDALGGAARDPKMLDRIKALKEETAALRKPLQGVRQTAKDLVAEAAELGVGNASHLIDDVDGISERLDDLQAKLDDRCSQLQSASTAMAQYNEKVKGLSLNLSALEQELDSMKPIGRDIKTVRSQHDDINKLIKKIVVANDDVLAVIEAGDHLVDSGFAPDTAVTREQTETLSRQLNRLDERARNRQNEIENMLDKLQDFQQNHTAALDDIAHAGEELRRLKPVGSEVEVIKSQQDEFASFRKMMIEPVAQSVDDVNKLGRGLIQSAAGGVNTSSLEKDLEKLNDKWNALKDKLNERDRKLDVGLLQSGKFQEALAGLAKWLTDTEEMVANQKPPSADYKVVKAQLQEQKFLKKMLLDRQNSMSSLFAMGSEVAAGADPSERKAIERQLRDLMQRFDNLTEGAAQRMDALERAMIVAKEFQDKLVPILEWLDSTEKKIKDMELIPTDEEKIQQRIKEHDALHKDILRKKPALTELTEVASALMALVGEDEASGVADKLQDTADRYTALVDASENVGQLLQASRAGLRHLVLTYQDLQAWMESMDNRLNRYKVMPVHSEKLLRHMEDLADVTEEIANRQMDVDSTVDSGLELMKHISNDEAIQLKDKLDSLQRRYHDLVSRGADLLKNAQEALPLVQQFHNSHNRLVDWMMDAESQLQVAEPREEEIDRLVADIQEFRPVLENINLIGPQLCQISPGEGAATIEGLVTRDNRRFDAIVEQIQRKAERIHLSKQRSLEVIGDIDELLDWFRAVEYQLRDSEPPSAEPDIIRMQLKEHRALNDDISSQKSRVRDVLSTAKKVLRESVHNDEIATIREKMEDLKEMMDTVSKLSSDRLSILEQALPLSEHFHQSHADLSSWLDEMEQQVSMLAMPALRPDLIAQQQDRNEMFVQSINEHKPLIEKLNKTGEALIRLCNPEEGAKVQDIMDSDNARYAALRLELRQRQQALEKALQETSQFSDKLEGMLRALANTAEQIHGADPISAHPPRIRDQIDENSALVEDLDKREEAFLAVKKAANDVISKAPNAADPAVRDMKRKLEKLNNLWNEVQKATTDRGRSLDEALALAEKFWKELQAVMATLLDLQDSLNSQEPPAVQPAAIQQQQVALQEIKAEIDQTKPDVEQCRASGHQLMRICGEPDKPEVKKHIEDLDNAWDNITALFAKREENLINAIEKAMEFHETLQDILDFLDKAETRFSKLGPLGSDIDAVKRQISQLKQFKADVDPHMVKVEALNRQAQELTERTSAEQAAALKEPLASVNRRWDELLRGIVERQRQLENALLRLGQFQHALAELLAWIDATNKTLDNELKPVAGDPQLLEIELAKLKVLVNDIQAHQSSVDTLNDAGRQLIESGKGTDEASTTQDKLSTLNRKWRDLLQKAADRQLELEEALRDAQRFAAEIQDLLSWLGEVDGVIAASKPVGGLPETATEQLERFMEVYNELEDNRPKVETVLAQGQEYLKKSPSTAGNLQHNLKTLKQRWDSVTARANDKKIKLEIALKEATEFHEALQSFIDWLTNAEKVLTNLKPVSRVLQTILSQIEEHKSFQKDVSAHREAMLHLDKKGTHLKYFSQKQDVILIKNLLISVQHRWERVVAKSAERTRALDHGYKEAREFHDAWSNLMNWLSDTEKGLDELAVEASSIGNDPEKIKQRLAKHREFQRALSGKQATYDSTMRMGKALKERAPKSDEPHLRQMMAELKEKWNSVCSKSVDRQRKLEEALLYCGQFKDALEALLDWLKKTEKALSDEGPVHGDLDTVNALIDQHKAFEQDLSNRASQLESVKETAKELIRKASPEDAAVLRSQLNEIDSLWTRTNKLSERKNKRLMEALRDAEELHRSVHMLLEWLSDAEMKLRFAATLPEDDQETRNQLFDHEKFMRELADKEHEKDATIALAQRILEKAHPDAVSVIKHWITIIQSRWDEVSTWAKQRDKKLSDHLRSLQDLDTLLEELLAWLIALENKLLELESEPLPDDIPIIERLIEEHKEFMETTSQRQHDIDTVCKAKQVPHVERKAPAKKVTPSFKSSRDNLLQDKHGSKTSVGSREKLDTLPHYGPRFPPKGSKATEPTFRNPRCKQLYDKWRNVWILAWERQRRLQEKLNYLKELEKVRNFSWDDWRKRFLKFMNHKKSRLTDLFRKMDKNNDGLIPRDDFIDGIMKTKFDTSKLEMNAVADMFDHDGAGLIDWKEFIAALRPDWEEKRPDTEAEKIHDEVKRLVMLCTCRQKFRVFQVGEGKYRFGDSQKLRLVRILRSTVMVRVGGGWVALDEFLVKNDPCRVEMLPMPNPYIPEEHEPWCPYSAVQLYSKGRTNIELREQFILADGVSQSMSAFKPKHSTASEKQKSVSLSSNTGPITKIRERTTRSVPLGKTVNRNIGTPDSLSDTESSPYARTPIRKAATPTFKGGSLPGSRGNSRPASRQGSKPPSRHGSNLSLDSTDDGTPSRIPRRSTSSSKSSGLSSRKPLNGSLSSTRSPSGLTSPISADSRSGSSIIHRASSIPTLSAINSSGSRIPVYVGSSSADTSQQISVSSSSSGARTPSGTSTPISSATGGTRLQRKSSGASDISRRNSKTPTPTELRAPFRL